MALFKLLLTGFEFPATLRPKNSNFRFVFYLRHFDASGETWVTTEAISPGLSTYWECDQSKAGERSNDAKYVRDGANPQFGALSAWDQVILLVNSSELFQMRVVVYDVNRKDWVDHLRELGEGLIGALVGTAKGLSIPSQLAAPVGTFLDRLRDGVVSALAKKDTVLFAVTYEFGSNQSSQLIRLAYDGYAMRLQLFTSGQSASEARAAALGADTPLTPGRIDASSAFAQVPMETAVRSKKGKAPRGIERKGSGE